MAVWHVLCSDCRYEGASLEGKINLREAHADVDETSRELGLRGIRTENFRELLTTLRAIKPTGKLLEVGAAHAWFLDEARTTYEASGIEPDEHLALAAQVRGHDIRIGYFPGILQQQEAFDVIVFNDVFEHLPDVVQALAACHTHLNDKGLLLINLPNSDGLFYRASKLLHRLGMPSSFERMWQKDLPSPHLHYFNGGNLQMLLRSSGFSLLKTGTLRSIRIKGLYERIGCANRRARIRNVVATLGAIALMPFLPLLPSDIIYLIAEKPT